jgi:signal transduction histidine kinase
MGWVGRLFDERDTFVRLLLLDLSGLGYLFLRPHDQLPAPTTTELVIAVVAFTTILALHRWPFVNLLTQASLLAVSFAIVDDPTIAQVGASWALLELTMWARRRSAVWIGVATVIAIYGWFGGGGATESIPGQVYGLLVVIGLPVVFGFNVRASRELARRAAERAAEEQRRHDSETRAARADERSAIARELHDVVAHHVASMVLRVGVARHVLPDADPRVTEVFDDVHRTGSSALADLRQLVALLRDPDAVRRDAALTTIEPTSLPAALRATVDRAEQTGLTVAVDIDASVGSLDAVRGLAVLRLTQEALTNVAKHVGPTQVRLAVSAQAGAVRWEVIDDGPAGGALPERPVAGGHGLTGMRERVEVLGGRLEAGPYGAGWRLATVLPSPETADVAGPAA